MAVCSVPPVVERRKSGPTIGNIMEAWGLLKGGYQITITVSQRPFACTHYQRQMPKAKPGLLYIILSYHQTSKLIKALLTYT